MSTSHTPGPWFIGRRTNDGGTTHHSITASEGHGWANDRYMSVSGCIDEHDARLIAAAPELLEALRRVMDIDQPIIGNPTHAQLVEYWEYEKSQGRGEADDRLFALAAIAKATGEKA